MPRSAPWFLLILSAVTPVAAQSLPAPAGNGASRNAGAGAPVAMSPFEVSAEADVGYRSGNTLSGSRLNTALKDTATAIRVFTPEFLADFGVNSLADLIAHGTNMAADLQETSADANPQFMGSADQRDVRIRVRGLAAATSVDFFETGVPLDAYNTERIEISSGANAILFGYGAAGGLVNVTTKRANLTRGRSAFGVQTGQWAQRRGEVDHNQVLVPGRLAVRLNGLLQRSAGWRTWDFSDASRGAVAVRVAPFSGTTVSANFENGQLKSHASRPVNAFDAVRLWQARGALTKADAAFTAADRANGINRMTATRTIHVTDADGTAPFTLTTSNANNQRLLESTYEDLNLPAADRVGLTLMPRERLPYFVSYYGPGSTRDQNFDRFAAVVEQRLGRAVTVEFAYNRERTGQYVRTLQANQHALGGDPNTVIPDPGGGAVPISNPNAGGLFMEGRWAADTGNTAGDVVRAAAVWEVELDSLGSHRIAGMAERGEYRTRRLPEAQILVDGSGVPLGNATNPENGGNFVWRRHYVAPDRLETYYPGDAREAFTVTRNGRTYRPVWVNSSVAGGDVGRDMRALQMVAQSRFWRGRLVTTIGGRYDRVEFRQYGVRRYQPGDPEVVEGRRIVNEVAFTGGTAEAMRHAPVTGTQGAVIHVTDRFSVFFNHATNHSQPSLNARVLPDESIPPPFEGRTRDAGVMWQGFGGQLFVRATAFETSQNKASGGAYAIALNSGENNLVAPNARILDALLAAGRITAGEHSAHQIGDLANLTGTSDIVNRGGEISAWLDVSPQFTGVLNLSYTRSDRSRIVPEFEGWFERETAFWHRSPGAGAVVNATSNTTVDQEAQALQRIMEGARAFYGFGYGERPLQVNVSGRYAFSRGGLRGAFAGAAARWASAPKLGRVVAGRTTTGQPTFGATLYGPEDFKLDGFVGYRRRLGAAQRGADLTLQINVTNLTDEDEVVPLRYNSALTGYTRALLNEPRRFRFSAGVSF